MEEFKKKLKRKFKKNVLEIKVFVLLYIYY